MENWLLNKSTKVFGKGAINRRAAMGFVNSLDLDLGGQLAFFQHVDLDRLKDHQILWPNRSAVPSFTIAGSVRDVARL